MGHARIRASGRAPISRLAVAGVAAALLLAACDGGDDEANRTTTRPPTTTEQAATSTSSGAVTSATTAPPTSAAAGDGSSCAPTGDTAEVRDSFPERMSALVGADVRTGVHDCFERFVVELQPSSQPVSSAFPGYWVRYATGPVVENPEGSEVTLRGDAVLLVSLGSPMRPPDGGGYTGPVDVVVSGDRLIEEYRLIEDFEGQSTWAIGLDRPRPFTVTVLDGPDRLVVDVAR